MFIENKEYEPFALEFKRCYKELISKLSEIWNEYDFEMGVGDPYAFPNYTKEEIEKKNNELNNKIKNSLVHVRDEKVSLYRHFQNFSSHDSAI